MPMQQQLMPMQQQLMPMQQQLMPMQLQLTALAADVGAVLEAGVRAKLGLQGPVTYATPAEVVAAVVPRSFTEERTAAARNRMHTMLLQDVRFLAAAGQAVANSAQRVAPACTDAAAQLKAISEQLASSSGDLSTHLAEWDSCCRELVKQLRAAKALNSSSSLQSSSSDDSSSNSSKDGIASCLQMATRLVEYGTAVEAHRLGDRGATRRFLSSNSIAICLTAMMARAQQEMQLPLAANPAVEFDCVPDIRWYRGPDRELSHVSISVAEIKASSAEVREGNAQCKSHVALLRIVAQCIANRPITLELQGRVLLRAGNGGSSGEEPLREHGVSLTVEHVPV